MASRFWLVGGCLLIGLASAAQPAPATLRSRAPFPIGAALSPVRLTNDATYRQTVEREYSSITSENHLKMHHVHPAADRYDWAPGNVLVDFAAKTGKRMHGHALLWHEAMPKWVQEFQGDSLAWEALVRDHITTVVQHYRGRIAAWDVVNEAFSDDGTLRNTLWRQKLGPDYVARCFQYARQADPAVKLFYNEYGQEYSPRKLQAVLNLVADLRRRGISIDGVGLQMHTHIDHPIGQIENAIRQTAATGLLVHIFGVRHPRKPEIRHYVPANRRPLAAPARPFRGRGAGLPDTGAESAAARYHDLERGRRG